MTKRTHRRGQRDHELRRQPSSKEPRSLILIVCEGEETEYRYFETMRKRRKLPSVTIEVVRPNRQSDQLVLYAIKLRSKKAADSPPYNEIWCVFDREAANEPAGFAEAVKRADQEDIQIAVSNPCFEYWYLLHYRETNRPFYNADEVCELLRHNDCLPGYQKNQDVFEQLADRMLQALERAERLYEQHPDRAHDRFPNASTLVQRLIRRLIK
jgi:hypothetical protein